MATERGHHVIALATFIQQQEDQTASVDIAVLLGTSLTAILDSSRQTHKLPNAVMGKV